MTTNISRSLSQSLVEGATDGKQRKPRPDTTVAPGMGEQQTRRERGLLHPNWNYGYITAEAHDLVEPTGR